MSNKTWGINFLSAYFSYRIESGSFMLFTRDQLLAKFSDAQKDSLGKLARGFSMDQWRKVFKATSWSPGAPSYSDFSTQFISSENIAPSAGALVAAGVSESASQIGTGLAIFGGSALILALGVGAIALIFYGKEVKAILRA